MPYTGRRRSYATRRKARRRRIVRRRAPVKRRRRARARRVGRRTYNTGKQVYGFGKDLRSYIDPFAQNQNPRIPDGTVNFSQGIQHQCSRQLQQTDGASTMTIVLFPGLENGVNYSGTINGAIDESSIISWTGGVTYTGMASLAPVDRQGAEVNQWRCVSSGMKLKLVNSTEDNSGWFECVRLTIPSQSDYFRQLSFDGSKLRFGPSSAGNSDQQYDFPYTDPRISMVDNASYCTDSLKNIDKHMFVLAPVNPTHKWRQTEKQIEVAVSGAAPSSLKEALVDDSYDCIVVRIHGTSGGAAGTETRIQLQSSHNHEYVYDINSDIYKLMTNTDYVNNDMLRMTGRKKNMRLRKAAIFAARTAYNRRDQIKSYARAKLEAYLS